MNWRILFGLLAFGVLLAGCAGKGAQAPSAPPGGQITAPPAEVETPSEQPETAPVAATPDEVPPVEETVPLPEEPATTPVEETPAVEPPTPADGRLGDLFQIDTEEPLEGSGYDVPEVGE